LDQTKLSNLRDIYALVRTAEQATEVRQHDVKPLLLDVGDVVDLKKAIVENEITIVFFLIDAVRSTAQTVMIEALAEVHQRTGKTVHFLHTSGAKNLQ
jgi:saccharopine dehydrogenase-like NADP-dependent oxidoreductase